MSAIIPLRLRRILAANNPWMRTSSSTLEFCSSTSAPSFSSACGWAGRRTTSKTSRSAAGAFPGGRCSLPSSRPRPAPALFSARPAKAFRLRNYTYLQLAFGTIIARVFVSYIFIKPYYDYKVFSIYEYLTLRFGTGSKNAASAVFMITRVLASGARLYVAAIALVLIYELLSGSRPGQFGTLLIYIGASIVLVVITAIYTTLGGIKAVVWTDFIQASIMMGSALVALVLLYYSIPGGWAKISALHGGFHFSDLISTGLDPARSGWDKWKGMFDG